MSTRDNEVLRAARVLSDYCKSRKYNCGDCLLKHAHCGRAPENWEGLAELEDEPKEEKTLQIKTICNRLDNFIGFDRVVNEALANGRHLVKRYIIPAYSGDKYNMLVVELERKVPSHD